MEKVNQIGSSQVNFDRLNKIITESLSIVDGVPLPSLIEISPIDMCNRSCSFCPRSLAELTPNNPVSISWSLIEKLYRELLELKYQGLVSFCGYGEPFMYEDLCLAVGLLTSVCKVDIITNGDFLTSSKIEVLLNFGLNKLLISVYDSERLPKIERIVRGFPEDKIEIRKRYENDFITTNRGGVLGDDSTGHSFNLTKEEIATSPCYYLSYSTLIDWNGDVLLCPMDWNRHVKFGNLNYSKLFDIWKSPYMSKYRKELFSGRIKPPCNKCNTRGIIHGLEHKEAWIANFK